MRIRLGSMLVALMVVWSAPSTPLAQKPTPNDSSNKPAKKNPLLKLIEPWPEPAVMQVRREEAEKRPLFQQPDPLHFTLTANFNAINKDRDPNSTQRFPGVLSLTDARGREVTIHVKLGSRGHFRKMARNCGFVPLRVELPKDEIAGTLFEGQTNLKLGTHCENDGTYDQSVLREYLTYRLHNMVTPKSFRARLARATYVDAKSNKAITTRYAIFIEHENDVARRLGGRVVELPRLNFKDVDAGALNSTMLFEYMIGNTDFSLWALHNVRVVQDPAKTLFTVPYDFDLSGFVHAPYARVDPRLGIRAVTDRLYRGPCRTPDQLEPTVAEFRSKRTEMIALLDGMKELDSAYRADAKDYLESFFRATQPSSIKRTFLDSCKPQETM
jgi:hypothetical protein